uniref:NERD domain-containing protein n=1 Tax=Heterorhabditis bacteriophora TaxID=37862 RepID=A0A1I7XCV8_HETBA
MKDGLGEFEHNILSGELSVYRSESIDFMLNVRLSVALTPSGFMIETKTLSLINTMNPTKIKTIKTLISNYFKNQKNFWKKKVGT